MTLEQIFTAAVEHHQAGRLPEAQSFFRQILALDPRQPNVLHRLARVTHELGDHPAAEALLRQALQLAPENADLYIDLGLILLAQSRTTDAIAATEKALALRPTDPAIPANLAYMFHLAGRPRDGIAACQKALALRPDYPDALNNLGINLAELHLFDQAIAAYQKALALTPNFPRAHNNLAVSLNATNRCEEALAACRRALALDPTYADAHNNAGTILQNLAQHDAALAAFHQAITLLPNFPSAHDNYLFAHCYHPTATPAQLHEASRRWANSLGITPAPPPPNIDRSPNRPLRIGYVSADLRFHSVAFFLLPLLEAHDRSQFHITCYPNHFSSDEITARLRAASDQWRPIAHLSDADAFHLIRQDQIDILIDLAGHTAHNRLPLFARKPAPLQISWLGYPAPTGLPTIDYRLTDPVADPVVSSQWSVVSKNPSASHSDHCPLTTDHCLPLPQTAWCFSPLSGTPPLTPPPHLANHHLTFGSLNNFAKLNDPTLHLWARLLHAIPHSRLALKAPAGPETAARLHHLFAEHAITPDRLHLLPKLPNNSGHLERYHHFDIALDTFPYNGTTTTCEALWMGVPVITLAGTHHASRVGASLLTTLNLPDLIAQTPDQFLTLAQSLAADSPRLQSLRTTFRPRMQTSPLMNAPQFARDIESAYRQAWQQWCETANGLTP